MASLVTRGPRCGQPAVWPLGLGIRELTGISGQYGGQGNGLSRGRGGWRCGRSTWPVQRGQRSGRRGWKG